MRVMHNYGVRLCLFGICFSCLLSAASAQEIIDSIPKRIKDNFVSQYTVERVLSQFAGDSVLSQRSNDSTLPGLMNDSILLERMRHSVIQGLSKDSFRLKLPKPDRWIKPVSGYLSYQFDHRTNADNPFLEKNISQHTVAGSMDIIVGGYLPLNIMLWSRQSNSEVFRDITDIRVSFNGSEFRRRLQSQIAKQLEARLIIPDDSLLERLYRLKEQDWLNSGNWLNDPLNTQRLIEANEIVQVPRITYDLSLPEEVNRIKADSLRKRASLFIEQYEKNKQEYNNGKLFIDSLRVLYNKRKEEIKVLKEVLQGNWQDKALFSKLKSMLPYPDTVGGISRQPKWMDRYKWLLNVRNASIGRNTIDHSELTVKNINVKGLNFEYNSWYYLAITAGMVDYSFQNLYRMGKSGAPQYLYAIRAGIGSIERTNIILSVYSGQKRLYTSGRENRGTNSFNTTGFSLAGRLRIDRNTYIDGELAQSVSPDFRQVQVQAKKVLGIADMIDKAAYLHLNSFIPRSKTKLEARYKYSGASFQSFSSFQTNAALRAWDIKAEQSIFNRVIKLKAGLKTDEFSNPYIIQDYSSNALFKSFSATFRLKKWPVISIGYLPMTQVTNLDNQLMESRFQSFNINGFYSYKLANIPLASTLIYNRFYTKNSDPAFVFYNASNIFFSQNLSFPDLNASLSVSHTGNGSYRMNVMEEGFQFMVKQRGTVGAAIKICNLNGYGTKMGASLNASIRLDHLGIIYLSYERNYLPGYKNGLTKNDMATIQFTRNFSFR